MFIHGGGWILGDYPTHKRLVRDIVVDSQLACVFVEYSRSPEVKFPATLNECYAATKWVAENDILVDGRETLGHHLDEAGVFVTTGWLKRRSMQAAYIPTRKITAG